MAATRVNLLLVVIISFFCLIQALRGNYIPPSLQMFNTTLKSCNFGQIYQFGDSLADTGNRLFESTAGAAFPFALASGLPLLNPYKNVDADFRQGVNFAVAGAGALPVKVLADWFTPNLMTNSSLNVQLDWMSTYFNSICQTNRDCAEMHRSALFVVGEIGGNDIGSAINSGESIEEVCSMMPIVVQAIKDAVQRVIGFGAHRIIVPGNFPMGCLPATLTMFQTNNLSAYDELNCLKEVNNLSVYENELIQLAIKELQQENPNVTIVYADYYNAYQWLYRNAEYLGFDVESLQKSCCGTGGDYNFNASKFCGDPEVPVCEDPSQFIVWDGVHLTQAAYKFLTSWITIVN